jgi:4-amino-4-deoxy-L-arabinose transferase-like glycosyltransferase
LRVMAMDFSEKTRANTAILSVRVLLLFFTAAFLVRFFFLFYVFDPNSFFVKYIELSRRFTGEILPPIEVFYSSPFYVLFISFLRSLFSFGAVQIKIVQIFFGSLNVVLIYFLGRMYFSKKTAVLAAAISVVYGPFILHDCSLLTATYVIFFNLLGIVLFSYFLNNKRTFCLVSAGLVFGLSLITRPNTAIFVIFLILILLFRKKDAQLKSRIGYVILFALAVFVPVLPVAGINYAGSGEPVLISNSGGWVFYCSNNRSSSGLGFFPPEELMLMSANKYFSEKRGLGYTEHLDAVDIARAKTGYALNHKGVSAYWFNRGLEEIIKDPKRFLKLSVKKCFYAVNRFEAHDTVQAINNSWKIALIPLAGFGLVAPLALTGVLFFRRTEKWSFVLVLYLFSYLVSLTVLYVIPRFRLPAEPVLILFAAHAVFMIIENIRLRKLKTLVYAFILITVFSVLVNATDSSIYVHREIAMPNSVRFSQGTLLLKKGRADLAILFFKKNLELNPYDMASSYCLKLAYKKLNSLKVSQEAAKKDIQD